MLKIIFNYSNILVLVLLAACTKQSSFHEIKVPANFSVKVPDYLSEKKDTTFINSLFCEDTVRSVIFIVVKESKDTMRSYGLNYNLNSYFTKISKSLTSKLTQGLVSNYYPLTINSNQATVADIKGTNQGEKLYYKLAIIETPKNFYQLIYSILADNATGLKQDIDSSMVSFKEL